MNNQAAPEPHGSQDSGRDEPQVASINLHSGARTASQIKLRIDQPQEPGAPIQLPAFRELQMLMNVIADENVDFVKFCAAMKDVPQVKNRILRDATSILSGRVNRIDDLKHAVAMLGIKKVRTILKQLAEPYENKREESGDDNREEVARISA